MSIQTTGQLDYRDPERPIDQRVEDLLRKMSLEEKAGLCFHTMLLPGPEGALNGAVPQFDIEATTTLVNDRHITHFNLFGTHPVRDIAVWHNNLQDLAAQTRWGIPVTISTDPRHSFTANPGTGAAAGGFSQWPETTGLAATGDADLVARYADTVRREYLAVGLRVALHPQIDLATEPRWSRSNATFGQDADLTSRLVTAYIKGLQGDHLGSTSVVAMTKHFPGGGPQRDGEDPHFAYGREQVYPGGMFDYHLAPFRAAIAAGTTQMMPYYGMPIGTVYEEVGFGFNKGIVTDLLRDELGFDGIVVADWRILTDGIANGDTFPARAWGVEHLSPSERMAKAIAAGVDQFGGETCADLLVDLVRAGIISEERLDRSARRLLREKFALGLFDNPYVDIDAAEALVGTPTALADGLAAQSAAITVLKNGAVDGEVAPVLPVAPGARIYVQGIDPAEAARYGAVVDTPEQADLAIVRLETPYEPRPNGLEPFFHAGRLNFTDAELRPLLQVMATVPTVVDIYLERAAVIPEINDHCTALVADFGASDRALLDVLFGRVAPRGRLPFDLPSSMEEVAQQRPDAPGDTPHPLYRFGDGLSWRTEDRL